VAPGASGWFRSLVQVDKAMAYRFTAVIEFESEAQALDMLAQASARATHAGKLWKNTSGAVNSWEPGVFGWTEVAE
jgi:hypothetical protein